LAQRVKKNIPLNDTTKILKLVYEEHIGSLYSYGCKFTTNKELVKDCIHDVFVRLYEKANIDSVQNMRFYLLRSLKNRLIDELSKVHLFTISEELPFTIPHQLSVEQSFVENEGDEHIKNMVTKALDMLTNRQREAVYLYYIEELDYDSICKLMNMNYQSVRNLIHRSITRLREHFDKKELALILSYCQIGIVVLI